MNKKTTGFISIVCLLSVTCFFSINLYFQQRSAHDELDISTFPYEIGEWRGVDLEIEELTYEILQTRNLLIREYAHPSGMKISLNIIYSETNRAVFHPPEVCLIGSGIEILDKQIDTIESFNGQRISANKIYLNNNGRKNISLYCYKVGDFYTENFYLQQIYFALNQLVKKGVRGATIHALMPIVENEETTLAILREFFRQSAGVIDGL